MKVKTAINKIRREIKAKGYRENICYPVFYQLKESIKDKHYTKQCQIEANFWSEYYKL